MRATRSTRLGICRGASARPRRSARHEARRTASAGTTRDVGTRSSTRRRWRGGPRCRDARVARRERERRRHVARRRGARVGVAMGGGRATTSTTRHLPRRRRRPAVGQDPYDGPWQPNLGALAPSTVQLLCALHRSREHMFREKSGRGSRRARMISRRCRT
ncbi:hypothetical protein K523DRAFT_363295 [Schizophyllum commune Tattone D]|nr:hypothetical protein K523DRAFT_363295 [Schizophyllum commune Tattone D]